MRAVSSSAKCRPVPGAPHSRITLRAAGRLGAQHKGPAHGPHHAVHKGVLPQGRSFSPRPQGPQSCPDALRFVSAVPLASRPSLSISRSIYRAVFQRRWASASCFFSWAFSFQQRRAVSAAPEGPRSGPAGPRSSPLCPAAQLRNQISRARARPRRRRIRDSQLSGYAIVRPSLQFSSQSVPRPVLQGFCLLQNPRRLFTLQVCESV